MRICERNPAKKPMPITAAEGRTPAHAVLVADVVEHAEQGAVAHRQQGEDQPERHEERRVGATAHGSAP